MKRLLGPTTPTFKPRSQPEIDERRQTERWSLTQEGGGQRVGLSVSSIEKWLDCREQFRLEKAMGLRGRTGSAAIDFGEWWHWLLGRHYQGLAANQSLEQSVKVYRNLWQRENANAVPKRLEAMELGYLKTAALWPAYLEKYAEDDAKKKWVGVELDWNFGFSIPRDESLPLRTNPGKIVPLRGIFDGVFEEDGELWLFETKTKSRIDEAEIEDTMHLDLQVGLYLYAIKRFLKRWPVGVQYNVIRNPSTEPGKQKKANPAEGHSEFIARLSKDVSKDEDHYFKRWSMPVSQADIERFVEKQLFPIVYDIRMWADGYHPHYIHTKALTGKYGKADMYDAITKGDFTGLEQVPLDSAFKER